jgi:hypothetical protein
MTDINDLMREARQNPAKPVIEGLLHEGETVGLHGAPEVFKTIFTLQLAESLATGTPFLGIWDVPRPRSVYYLETEMSVTALGERLSRMFRDHIPPNAVHFADESRLRQFRRAPNLAAKFDLLKVWVREAQADFVILDTCNPFFRGKESPNDETTAGMFFDLLAALPGKNTLFVRHNHKRRQEDADSDSAGKIRGSGQFADVPDLLIEMRRMDKRTSEAQLAVSKFRHGSKPEDVSIWFDSGDFRLITIPPVIHVLLEGPLHRPELLNRLKCRFGIGERKADEIISKQRIYLIEKMAGHKKVFEVDWDAVTRLEGNWFRQLRPAGEGERFARLHKYPPPLDDESAINQTQE